MRYGVFIVTICTFAVASDALVAPKPGQGDPHIQWLTYDAEEVYLLEIPLGYASTVQIAPDERIENLVVGNSAVWQVAANKRADHLIIKPMQGATATNLVVITDAHYYNFQLSPLLGNASAAPYLVRFKYPLPSQTDDGAPAQVRATYKLAGDRNIWPVSIAEETGGISMTWAQDTPMPAVFAVDAAGRESLVTGRMVDGKMLIEGSAPRYILRLGTDKATATRFTKKMPK